VPPLPPPHRSAFSSFLLHALADNNRPRPYVTRPYSLSTGRGGELRGKEGRERENGSGREEGARLGRTNQLAEDKRRTNEERWKRTGSAARIFYGVSMAEIRSGWEGGTFNVRVISGCDGYPVLRCKLSPSAKRRFSFPQALRTNTGAGYPLRWSGVTFEGILRLKKLLLFRCDEWWSRQRFCVILPRIILSERSSPMYLAIFLACFS